MKPVILLVALAGMFGCPSFVTAHDGPHGGELFCDDKHSHHAELVVDKKANKATVYILDKKAKKEVPIAAKTIVMMVRGSEKPMELMATNMKEGKASQFVLKHEHFGSKLKIGDLTFEIVLQEGKKSVTFKPEHDDE